MKGVRAWFFNTIGVYETKEELWQLQDMNLIMEKYESR